MLIQLVLQLPSLKRVRVFILRSLRPKSGRPEGEEVSPYKETRIAWSIRNFVMKKKASGSTVRLRKLLLVCVYKICDELRVRQD